MARLFRCALLCRVGLLSRSALIARAYEATWSGMLGYRALYADYSKGAGDTPYQYDLLQHGPIVGVSARF